MCVYSELHVRFGWISLNFELNSFKPDIGLFQSKFDNDEIWVILNECVHNKAVKACTVNWNPPFWVLN